MLEEKIAFEAASATRLAFRILVSASTALLFLSLSVGNSPPARDALVNLNNLVNALEVAGSASRAEQLKAAGWVETIVEEELEKLREKGDILPTEELSVTLPQLAPANVVVELDCGEDDDGWSCNFGEFSEYNNETLKIGDIDRFLNRQVSFFGTSELNARRIYSQILGPGRIVEQNGTIRILTNDGDTVFIQFDEIREPSKTVQDYLISLSAMNFDLNALEADIAIFNLRRDYYIKEATDLLIDRLQSVPPGVSVAGVEIAPNQVIFAGPVLIAAFAFFLAAHAVHFARYGGQLKATFPSILLMASPWCRIVAGFVVVVLPAIACASVGLKLASHLAHWLIPSISAMVCIAAGLWGLRSLWNIIHLNTADGLPS